PKFTFEPSADPWHVGYGYQFWISPYPGSYRADGAFGQITTILPEKGLVVSIQCLYFFFDTFQIRKWFGKCLFAFSRGVELVLITS
ncbi:MAG: hypothetical protein MR966_12735, partial [Lachnospiraceae bacterium]|nr:hypothetical protein [Lachnospiraceae bacterium]